MLYYNVMNCLIKQNVFLFLIKLYTIGLSALILLKDLGYATLLTKPKVGHFARKALVEEISTSGCKTRDLECYVAPFVVGWNMILKFVMNELEIPF